eukprot:45124-Prymnesium_polylepis.1
MAEPNEPCPNRIAAEGRGGAAGGKSQRGTARKPLGETVFFRVLKFRLDGALTSFPASSSSLRRVAYSQITHPTIGY